jgi:hypothetical protein
MTTKETEPQSKYWGGLDGTGGLVVNRTGQPLTFDERTTLFYIAGPTESDRDTIGLWLQGNGMRLTRDQVCTLIGGLAQMLQRMP